MVETKQISLFWWSETRLMGKKKENYGDLISNYLVKQISSKIVKWVQPKKQAWYRFNKTNYLTAGSIIHHCSEDSIVWGSGIIDNKQEVAHADFRAVRGPKTRDYILKLGYDCPEIYGDPALLLPRYYAPFIEKEYKVGVIPHYNDYKDLADLYSNEDGIIVIDLMTMDIEAVTDLILSCDKTISSSLHGVIVSHAYNIPSVWVEFSDKIFGDGIKYIDYLESVGLPVYEPIYLDNFKSLSDLEVIIESYPNLPSMKKIKELQDGLMMTCPFIQS